MGKAHAAEQIQLLNPHKVIQKTNSAIAVILDGDLPILKKINSFVVASGGKRIRPLFTYYMGTAYNLGSDELLKLGALLEIVHAASLLHDDVVDGAEERRAKPTGAKLFGNKQVILGGDHLLAAGLKYLNTLGNSDYMAIFTDAIQCLSRAELLQMQHHFNLQKSEKEHTEIIDGKTAVLFRAAGELVATMRNRGGKYASSETARLGTLFGRYFQERDDHLDYFDSRLLQKKGLQDFTNGVATLPLISLFKKASQGEKRTIGQAWHEARVEGSLSNPKEILALMEKYGIEELSQKRLSAMERQILDQLASLPGKKPREVITAEFQKILAVRSA